MEELNQNQNAISEMNGGSEYAYDEVIKQSTPANNESNAPKKSNKKTSGLFKTGVALMFATSALSLGVSGYQIFKKDKNNSSNKSDNVGSVNNKVDSVTISEDGYWVINGVKTSTKAEAADAAKVESVSVANLDKWGISTQFLFKLSDNTYISTTPQTKVLSEHFYEAENASDIIQLQEYGVSKIKLTDNITINNPVDVSGNLVFDLNKKTLTYSALNPIEINENSELEFKNGSLNIQSNVGFSAKGVNAELSFDEVNLSASAAIAETVSANTIITLNNSNVSTTQSRTRNTLATNSLFAINSANVQIKVIGSTFETSKSIVSASNEAETIKLTFKDSKLKSVASILDVNTEEVVPTIDADSETLKTLSNVALNTTPITDGNFNFNPVEMGAADVNVQSFDVNGSYVLAEDLQDLVNKVEAGSTISLPTVDIYQSEQPRIELETSLVIDKKLTINIGDCMISTPRDTIGDGVFHVVEGGDLTIESGERGLINGVSASTDGWHMAVWVDGGKVTINGGTFTNLGATEPGNPNATFDLLYVKGGELVINGGNFICQTPIMTINKHASIGGIVIVNGGMFGDYNPAESHSEVPVENFLGENTLVAGIDGNAMGGGYNGTIYAVTSSSKLAEIVTTGYTYTVNGYTYPQPLTAKYIYLNGDVVLTEGLVIENELTLNLGNSTISAPHSTSTALFKVESTGLLIIEGNGTVNSASDSNYYSMAVWARNGGQVVINGGTFTNLGAISITTDDEACNNELIYTSGNGSSIIINGGTFIGNSENETYGERYTLNKQDGSNTTILVNAGTFVGYNPAESYSENPVENFVADGKIVVFDGTYYTVVDVNKFAEYAEKSDTTIINYVSSVDKLQAAIAMAGDYQNYTIKLLNNIDFGEITNNAITIPTGKYVTIDLNGYIISTIETTNLNGYTSFIHIRQDATLVINDSVGTGKIVYEYSSDAVDWSGNTNIHCEGSLILNNGTIQFIGDGWNNVLSFVVDLRPNVWGEAVPTTPASFIMNGGTILGDVGAETIRVAMNSSSNCGYAQPVTFTMNGGTVTGGYDAIFVQQLDSIYNLLNVNINAGTLYGTYSAVRIYNPAGEFTYAEGLSGIVTNVQIANEATLISNYKAIVYTEPNDAISITNNGNVRIEVTSSQELLKAVENADDGDVIHLTKGTFAFNTLQTINVTKAITIIGAGEHESILSNVIFSVGNSTNVHKISVIFDNLAFTGTAQIQVNDLDHIDIEITTPQVTDLTIRNCIADVDNSAISTSNHSAKGQFVSLSSSYDILLNLVMHNNTITTTMVSGEDASPIVYGNGTLIQNATFTNNTFGSAEKVSSRYAVKFGRRTDNTTITFENNTVYGATTESKDFYLLNLWQSGSNSYDNLQIDMTNNNIIGSAHTDRTLSIAYIEATVKSDNNLGSMTISNNKVNNIVVDATYVKNSANIEIL